MSDFRIGFALGGGAARGLFHAGAMVALEEAGIVPDILSGTSAGGLMAGPLAGGIRARDLAEEILKIKWQADLLDFRTSFLNAISKVQHAIFSRTSAPPPGILENSPIRLTINRLVGGRGFSGIKPLILTGTDIRLGEQVLFCSGTLAGALKAARDSGNVMDADTGWRRAYGHRFHIVPFEDVGIAASVTSCFPGAMSSVQIRLADVDGREEDRLLNDGGILEQVPVLPLRLAGCRKVIAVHLGFLPVSAEAKDSVSVLLNAVQWIARRQIAASLEQADYVLYDPQIEGTSMVKLDRGLVDRGYEFTRDRIGEIRRALGLPAGDEGELVSVNTATQPGNGKQAVPEARLVEGLGLEGDAHAGLKPNRQVSLMGEERLTYFRDQGYEVGPGKLGENLTVRGIDLEDLPVGARITIGDPDRGVVLDISHRGKLCGRAMARLRSEDRSILEIPRIYASVVRGGPLSPGLPLKVTRPPGQVGGGGSDT